MFMSADEFPLPLRVPAPALDGVRRTSRRTTSTSARSCSSTAATSTACRSTSSSATTLHILNIDHHHDNTRFGTVNLVVRRRVVHRGDRLATCQGPGRRADAARSRRRCTWPRDRHRQVHVREHDGRGARDGRRADRRPAWTSHEVYRRLYENLPFGRLQLLPRALAASSASTTARSRSPTSRARTTRRPAPIETDSEGIVDHIRAVEGTAWPALVRELLAEDREGIRKVSLRATDGRVDVSRDRARARRRRSPRRRPASRPSCACRELVDLLRAEVARSSSELRGADAGRGRPARRQAGRSDLARRRGRRCAGAARRGGVKVGHAGTLDPFATGLLLVLVGTRHARAALLMALPKTYRAVARLGWTSTPATATASSSETGRMPEPLGHPDRASIHRRRPRTRR